MSLPLIYIKLAEKLADIARPIVASYFRSNIKILDKKNLTPVTAADREAETAIRTVLESECPEHGVLGEEFGSHNLDAEYVWILDPIDGTKSFVTGKPLFGTLKMLPGKHVSIWRKSGNGPCNGNPCVFGVPKMIKMVQI